VQGVLDLLNLKVGSDNPDRELIEDGINVTKKMLRLIHNLLEVSRLESGELVLRHEAVDVAELVKESVAPLQLLASSRGVELATAVPDDLPPLEGDRARLTQVLDNLVTNAIKFTSEGGHVCVEARRDASGGLRIDVVDTGMGIAAEEMPDIFKRFRQGRSAGGRKKGTGLGLNIVDLLVKAHRGRVDVESQLGKGSRFTIHLPLESSKASPAGAPLA
jgi:signal transduction histidine kinase